MNDNPRIEALRRRVDKDPASIAFAQLAEEYRRGGDYEQAIAICREGLARHPGYLSAQVTLGRALIALKQFDEARKELEAVLRVAPDNLAAIRALAGIHEHLGDEDPIALAAAPDPGAQPPSMSEAIVEATAVSEPPTVPPFPDIEIPMVQHTDPALPALEQWLAAIVADRAHSR
jgi:tetratricopeptide (TPR) repeat protein